MITKLWHNVPMLLRVHYVFSTPSKSKKAREMHESLHIYGEQLAKDVSMMFVNFVCCQQNIEWPCCQVGTNHKKERIIAAFRSVLVYGVFTVYVLSITDANPST